MAITYLLLIGLFVQQGMSLFTASFNVSYNNSTVCTGYTFTVGISFRHRIPGSSAFTQWHLAYYILQGSNIEWHNVTTAIEDSSEIQYKMDFNDCITISAVSFTNRNMQIFTFQVPQLLCSSSLCTYNDQYVTKIINTSSLNIYENDDCCTSVDDTFSFVTGMTKVYPESKAQCLPFQPILSTNNVVVTLDFRMALRYPVIFGDCVNIELANEGILLQATQHNGTVSVPLHFYVPTNNISNDTNYIGIQPINSSHYILRYSEELSYTVPFTLSSASTSEKYNVNISDSICLNDLIKLSWIQKIYATNSHCSVWELDYISVTMFHNEHSREIYAMDLNSETAIADWDIVNGAISTGCNSDVVWCLLMGTGSSENVYTRQATTPFLNLQYIAPVILPTPQYREFSSCQSDEVTIFISFVLQLTQFIQPIIETDSNPNTILLFFQAGLYKKPISYYAPVGNYYWPQFNTATLYGVPITATLYGVPIYSPSPSKAIYEAVCISNATSSFSLSWIQNNYTIDSDIWSLSQVNVSLSSQQKLVESWLYHNGAISKSNCTDSDQAIFNLGNGSSPRIASLSINLTTTSSVTDTSVDIYPSSTINTQESFIPSYESSIAPSDESSLFLQTTDISILLTNTDLQYSSSLEVINDLTIAATETFHTKYLTFTSSHVNPTPSNILGCPSETGWSYTEPNQTVIGTCYRGTVQATRYCRVNGTWNDVDCQTSPFFDAILEKISTIAGLEILVKNEGQLTNEQKVYLFALIIESQSTRPVSNNFTQLVKEFVSESINELISNDNDTRRKLGSQLLLSLDAFALNLLRANATLMSPEFELKTQEVRNVKDNQQIEGLNGNSIKLPNEIFNRKRQPVNIASFVYQNFSSLLVPQNSSLKLMSPIVSATTDCANCTTTNLMNEQVIITFNLSNVKISEYDPTCVYWEFELSNDTLPSGHWSREGCKLNNTNGSISTCQCNHLTHFAILLSPGANTDEEQSFILTIIGYILVPVSLMCMLLTILTYVCMKQLWNMRNYIHVMLCINLFIAQLLFVVGIDRTQNEIVCSIIALVLQYMLLVTFMWMLMEGVVLYVALVKVFVKHTKQYILAFTLISYGVPALYVIAIGPIGFFVNTNDTFSHYLQYNDENDLNACWLSYQSGFIWTFIVPVVAIILINVGFLIMAIVIMKKHLKKQEHKSEVDTFKYWFKCSLSLIVVMGTTWIVNVIFFRKELLFIAYIMTIFIAGQGIVIFILYVPLSKHVRDAYLKWWRKKQANSELLSKLSFGKLTSLPLSDQGHHNGTSSVSGNVYDKSQSQITLKHYSEKKDDYIDFDTETKKSIS